MRDFKKAVLSTLAVFLIAALLSLALLIPLSPYTHNYDWLLREELAGSIDLLAVGASQCQCGLDTATLDEVLGCSSYNLSYDALQNYEKQYLLKKELARNPVKTVLLELSYDTMKSNGITNFTFGNFFSMMRMDSFGDRLRYLNRQVILENKWFVYSNWMSESIDTLKRQTLSAPASVDEAQRSLKGTSFSDSEDHRLSPAQAEEAGNSILYSVSDFNPKTIEGYTELISLCQEQGVEVIVMVVPVSDNYLWTYSNLEEFDRWARAYCERMKVPYFDFNLLRSRYTLFSDEDSFAYDTHHMSETGARVFSRALGDFLRQYENGEDVTGLFYPGYEEALADSPYAVP